MNFMDVMNSRFSDLSCKDLRKEKEKIDSEIKRRQDIKIKEINAEYKEKERDLRARFNDIASALGTSIPVDLELSDDVVNELAAHFISISYEYYNSCNYYGNRYRPTNMKEKIINMISVLSCDKEHNLVLMLAMKIELEKLDNDRLSDISKVREG